MNVHPNYIYFARIINVVDGDTVDMEVDLGFYVMREDRFRLTGINTAEINSQIEAERKKAQAAKAWLMQYSGKAVRLKSTKKDKYGRFLAEIFIEGDPESLNNKMINLGLAEVYV